MTTTATDRATLTDLRVLLAAMHAAGWRHRLGHEPSPRDLDGAPFHEGWYTHTWRRPGQEITVWRSVDSGRLEFAISFWASAVDPTEEEPAERISIDVDWVARHGIATLHRMADAAGVLEVTR
jgi:hypothetical protein